jgi:hypothetical protein
VTGRDIPFKSLQRRWRDLVLAAKRKASAAKISAIQTGGGEIDAPLINEEDARILAIGQAEVVFDNQGKSSVLLDTASLAVRKSLRIKPCLGVVYTHDFDFVYDFMKDIP